MNSKKDIQSKLEKDILSQYLTQKGEIKARNQYSAARSSGNPERKFNRSISRKIYARFGIVEDKPLSLEEAKELISSNVDKILKKKEDFNKKIAEGVHTKAAKLKHERDEAREELKNEKEKLENYVDYKKLKSIIKKSINSRKYLLDNEDLKKYLQDEEGLTGKDIDIVIEEIKTKGAKRLLKDISRREQIAKYSQNIREQFPNIDKSLDDILNKAELSEYEKKKLKSVHKWILPIERPKIIKAAVNGKISPALLRGVNHK